MIKINWQGSHFFFCYFLPLAAVPLVTFYSYFSVVCFVLLLPTKLLGSSFLALDGAVAFLTEAFFTDGFFYSYFFCSILGASWWGTFFSTGFDLAGDYAFLAGVLLLRDGVVGSWCLGSTFCYYGFLVSLAGDLVFGCSFLSCFYGVFGFFASFFSSCISTSFDYPFLGVLYLSGNFTSSCLPDGLSDFFSSSFVGFAF